MRKLEEEIKQLAAGGKDQEVDQLLRKLEEEHALQLKEEEKQFQREKERIKAKVEEESKLQL